VSREDTKQAGIPMGRAASLDLHAVATASPTGMDCDLSPERWVTANLSYVRTAATLCNMDRDQLDRNVATMMEDGLATVPDIIGEFERVKNHLLLLTDILTEASRDLAASFARIT